MSRSGCEWIYSRRSAVASPVLLERGVRVLKALLTVVYWLRRAATSRLPCFLNRKRSFQYICMIKRCIGNFACEHFSSPETSHSM